MTFERAFELLNPDTIDDMDYNENEAKEAMRIGMKAVGKQIPKKPDNDGFYSPFVCRACNCIVYESYAFCPDCGQAIKWK